MDSEAITQYDHIRKAAINKLNSARDQINAEINEVHGIRRRVSNNTEIDEITGKSLDQAVSGLKLITPPRACYIFERKLEDVKPGDPIGGYKIAETHTDPHGSIYQQFQKDMIQGGDFQRFDARSGESFSLEGVNFARLDIRSGDVNNFKNGIETLQEAGYIVLDAQSNLIDLSLGQQSSIVSS